MAAKNHGIIMPDYDAEDAINNLIGAAFGATGQRCMALPVAIFVGEAKKFVPALVEKAKALKLGAGAEKTTDVSPLCYSELKDRVVKILD